ncbi:hypothetical protein NW762_011262 [Fusarium torreyae]|uniref:Uncharacterized protein n=1 Tax=Fusarium torreyae TaxID=1237075 RepID=A0A9W8RQ17_9HYPO|nr:hypothetical protein NW762_011262 [Fusarium torreyae]
MPSPRRSKRLQARNEPEQDSPRVNKSKSQKNRKKALKKKPMRDQGDMAEQDSVNDEDAVESHRLTVEEREANKWSIQRQKELAEKHKQARAARDILHGDLCLHDHEYLVDKFWEAEMAGTIQTFAKNDCFQDVPWDSLDATTQKKFLSWAPGAKELFELDGTSTQMFRRWVWEIIDENFFSNKSKDIVWTSPFWEAQATIERYLCEHDFSFHRLVEAHKYPNWRLTTMQLYYSTEEKRAGSLRMEPSCVISILNKALGRYFPKEFDENSNHNLKLLSEGVACMEFYTSASLCSYSHVFHHPTNLEKHGFLFNPDVAGIEGKAMMAIDSTVMDVGRPVDLIAQPMLVARGNRDGFGYHVQRIVYPMQVCVDWLADYENMVSEEKAEQKKMDE